MSYLYKVGNDNGNAEHDIIINGEENRQPNVYASAYDLKGYDELLPAAVITDIMNQLLVSIVSPSCQTGTYLVGNSAIKSKFTITEFKVGFDKKSTSDIPVIATLAKIAGYAVLQKYKEIGNALLETKEEIDVAVEMATALPIDEFHENATNKEIFKERFLNGPHTVSVHLGRVQIRVTIKFMKVAVLPEAAPVYWFIREGLKNSEDLAAAFLEEFKKEYELESVDLDELANLRTLHLDIGSGTTEYPIVHKKPDPSFIRGENLGVGHAIEKALPKVRKEIRLPNLSRLELDKIILDKARFYEKAFPLVEPQLRVQAKFILDALYDEIRNANMEIDLILVYGGGSILLKEYLYDSIKKAAEETELARVLYAPSEFAVRLNALGLNEYANHKFDKNHSNVEKPKHNVSKTEVEA